MLPESHTPTERRNDDVVSLASGMSRSSRPEDFRRKISGPAERRNDDFTE